MEPIGYVRSDLPGKFGIPRQGGLVEALESEIVFEPAYRIPEAFRGIEEYSHLWILWGFHFHVNSGWSPTVRPPRLGGNTRVGVFATRSPFRPNPIGLSCVRLLKLEETAEGPVLHIAGGDMADGTPVYDIKPYVPYVDIRTDATGGFTDRSEKRTVRVVVPDHVRKMIPEGKEEALTGLLAEDPRPAYQDDPERQYAFEFAGRTITFQVREGILTILDIRE